MKTKKINKDLTKIACKEAFDVKQASNGVVIEGFANKATVDRGDEIITTDAWELDNFKKNPVILFNHGMDTLGGTPVGKALEVRQTDEGLYLKVKMSNSQAPGIKMVRDLVEERILKAFSVGFNPKESDVVQTDGKSIRKITKAELFEVSIVGVPMNQDSLFELSEKALATKSLHQLKGEILKAKGAEKAAALEAMFHDGMDRKKIIKAAAEKAGETVENVLAMLAGDLAVSDAVEGCLAVEIKAAGLKETLEAALAKLAEGADSDMVAQELAQELGMEQEDEEDEEEKEGDDPGTSSEEEEEGEKDKTGDASGEGAAEGGEEKEDDAAGDADKVKQDFQDCVSAMVPKLLEEGMEQDQAVAVAISKCQEQGKCQLTPDGKTAAFAAAFEVLEIDEPDWSKFHVTTATGEIFVKQVDDTAQTEQPPTTPVKTEDNEENFGSPFLEAAKQTNVLLGALINEIQKLSNKLDGLSKTDSVQSEEAPKGQENNSEADGKSAVEDVAEKRLDKLNQRLKNLGY